jgi:hypothetical protein
MPELSVEEAAEILQQYDQWLVEHMPELEAQYPGKIVAVENNQVIAVGATYAEVHDQVKPSERNWMPLIVEIPGPSEAEGFFLSF